MLPASTAAGTPGAIGFISGYCTGANTVNATFKLVKYGGYYATELTMTAKGQGYHDGRWQTEYNIGTWSKVVNTSSKATMRREFWYDAGHSGKHRIQVLGKIWNGSNLVGSGKDRSGWCS